MRRSSSAGRKKAHSAGIPHSATTTPPFSAPLIRTKNTFRRLRLQTTALKKLAHFFCARAFENSFSGYLEISITLVDDTRISELNQRYLGHAGPTDVISFRLEPPSGVAAVGEIVINGEQALREAARRNIDPAREVAWYLAHGIHHLAGARDDNAEGRAAMHRRERQWLKEAAQKGLLSNLLRSE